MRAGATRLDLHLVCLHPELSRRRARAAIEKGQVLVDGHMVREPGLPVTGAAEVVWDANRPALPRARCRLTILHEDDDVVVVDKPAGLLSVPTAPARAGREDTALGRILEYAAHRGPRRRYVAAVHRLDRDTSGALAFALTPGARATLRAAFRAHRIERRYVALVAGAPVADAGEVDRAVSLEYRGGRRRLAHPGEASVPALTRWHVVERLRGAALLELELHTGRQHQIRLHLAALGHPIAGDHVYGGSGRSVARFPRQMLHAQHLAFPHPTSGSAIRVTSPLPADFRSALEALRRRR